MSIHKKFCLLLATLTFAGASFAQTPDVKPEHIHGESGVIKEALFVRLEAKPGKEQAVAAFLASALALANKESGTPIWFALRLSPTTFGIFDAFASEQDRQTHLNGPIAEALGAHAEDLLATAPTVESIDVLGLKNRPTNN